MTSLRVIPLGGLGEIGKNMMLLEYGEDMIAVDAGVMFPRDDLPGIDLIVPDITYINQRRDKFRGIFVTHGHEDHIGAIPYVIRAHNVPVFCSPLTHGLITVKLKEARLLNDVDLHIVSNGDRIKTGVFDVEFFRVCHSIPDAMGLAIRTPVGTVIHTGDFKFDHQPVDGNSSDFGKLAQFGSDGVRLLMSDSTYAEVPGFTPSETVITSTMGRVIGEAKGRVIVATFASLIARIQQVIDAATNHDRSVCVIGRSMINNVQMAIKMGYITIAPERLVKPVDLPKIADDQITIITTGTQGEPTSALVRMANNDHHDISIKTGDTVVMSATPIPGNERLVHKTINDLFRQGARVLYGKRDQVHVHGHAAREELKTMISLINPEYFIPIHGEYRHLKIHAEIASSLGIHESKIFVMEDGSCLELTPDGAQIGARVTAGSIYLDGLAAWGMQNTVLSERRTLSRDGIVVAFVSINKDTGAINEIPNLISYGFVDTADRTDILANGQALITKALEPLCLPYDLAAIKGEVKKVLTGYFFQATKRRPTILAVAMEH